MGLWKDGWDAFVTPVRDFNNGARDCNAVLQATHTTNGTTTSYYGDSKAGHGHAEMDALYQFLADIQWDTVAFDDYDLTIECTTKPCCKYCAAVMGLMGAFAVEGTYKVNKSMGISYALPPDIRLFIKRRHNVTEGTILQELCG